MPKIDKPVRHTIPQGAAQFGRFYWGIKVKEEVSPSGLILAFADRIDIHSSGALILVRAKGMPWWGEGYGDIVIEKDDSHNLTIAPGMWLAYFSACIDTGRAAAVEHWYNI